MARGVLTIGILLLLLVGAAAPAAAWQPPPPGGTTPGTPMPWPEALGRFVGIWLSNLTIGLEKSVAALFWFLEKLACAFSGLLQEESLWQMLRESIVGALAQVMPGALRNLALGSTGLLYVALMLAGVLMAMPLFGESRPVQAWRVVLWGAVLSVLFVNGLFGYDLIGFIEELRVGAVRSIASTMSSAGVNDLVARPMGATAEEMGQLDFSLPAAFTQQFFPEPAETDYEEVRVMFFSGVLGFHADLKMETQASLENRRDLAGDGLGIAFLNLLPAWVVFLFGLIFAFLGAAALLLIVFFVAALPLGFFEFGTTILSGIVQQYIYIFALSLLVAVLAGLLGGLGAAVLPAGGMPVDVAAMVQLLPVMVVIGVMLQFGAKMAWAALSGTAGIMTRAMGSVAALAYSGSAPPPGGSPVSSLAKLAAGVGLAAATGGVGAALLAGVGSLLSGTSAGRAAAEVATQAAPSSLGAHVFAQSVQARGVADTASGIVATGIRFRRAGAEAAARALEQGARTFTAEVQRESRAVDPRWKAVDAGGFLTADLGALRMAESAYFRDKDRRMARRYLEQAFGSREVADEVMMAYARRGRRGAEQVRRVAETTQATALEMAAAGRPVFNDRGEATRPFQDAVRRRLASAGLLVDDPVLAGRVAGATVRKPVGIWADPDAMRKLAHDVLEPDRLEVAADLPAQYRLRDIATRLRLGESQLEELFSAVRQGQAAAMRSGESVEEEVYRIIARSPMLTGGPITDDDLREMARLSVMVARSAEVQRPAQIEVEPRAVPLAAMFNEEKYRAGVEAFYDRSDPEEARGHLVEALGSTRAADRMLDAWREHPRQEAEALPAYLAAAQDVAPAWDARGRPAPEYAEAVRRAAAPTTGGSDDVRIEVGGEVGVVPGTALFDAVAEDLLARMDERWAGRAEELAPAVLRGRGPAARELQEEADRRGWTEQDLADLIRRAVAEAVPPGGAAGGAVEVSSTGGADARLLALTRDALREVDRGGGK
jgi:hypothetical protein